MKSKQFKKLYADTMDNVPEKGVWSGRGIGIPALGAIGGGDDYKQKIGRGKIPYYHGNAGTPSQGADSTWSSYLARVNRGHEPYEGEIMFPEQEEDEEYIYYSDESGPIRSRKIPKAFKISRRGASRLKEMMKFNENDVVENSRYSMIDLFESDNINEGAGFWIIRKGIPALAKGFGLAIPGLDIILGTALAGLSVVKIKSASDRLVSALNVPENALGEALSSDSEEAWQSVMANITSENTNELKDDFDEFLDAVKSLFLTILQSADTAITAPVVTATAATGVGAPVAAAEEIGIQAVTGGLGFIGEMIPVERWLFDMAGHGAGVYEKIFEWMKSAGPDSARKWLDKMEEGGGVLTAIMLNPHRSFRRLGDFYRALHDPEEATPGELVVKGSLEKIGGPPGKLPAGEAEQDMIARIRSMVQSTDTPEFAALEELKSLIRESIYPTGTYHPTQPAGYEYRRVPTVVSKELESQNFDILDDYDDFSVAYKADSGVVSYQAKNKNKVQEAALRRIRVQEEALRRLIRRDINSVLRESQKKS